MDEEGGRRTLTERLGQTRKLPGSFCHCLLEIDAVGRVVPVEVRHEVLPLHGDDDGVGMECMEPTVWVQDVLPELARPCLIELDAQSLDEAERNEKIMHELYRKRRKQSHAQRGERWMRGRGLVQGAPDEADRSHLRIRAEQTPSAAHRPARVSGVEAGEE